MLQQFRNQSIQIKSQLNHSGEFENQFNWSIEYNWLKSMIFSHKSNIKPLFKKCIFTTEISVTFKIWLISLTFPSQESTILKVPDISRCSMTMKMGDFLLLKNWVYYSLLCRFVLWNASIGAGLTSYYECVTASQSDYNWRFSQLLPFWCNAHQLVNYCWFIRGSAAGVMPRGYGYNPAGKRHFTWTCKTEVKVLASSATPPR